MSLRDRPVMDFHQVLNGTGLRDISNRLGDLISCRCRCDGEEMLSGDVLPVCSHSTCPQAYRFLAVNKKLGLTGRPERPVGCIGTCKVYKE